MSERPLHAEELDVNGAAEARIERVPAGICRMIRAALKSE
jgi:hypothetical protein